MRIEGQYYWFDVDKENDTTRIGIMVTDPDTGIRKSKELHAQKAAILQSQARFVLLCAGKGAGKTLTGPPWLYQEILKRPGGPYLVLGPDNPRMSLQLIPYLEDFFDHSPLADPERRGVHLEKNIMVYNLGKGYGQIFLVAADTMADVRKVESIHALAGLFDEGGQTVNPIWDAFRARLNEKRSRALITTTAYTYTGNWLKEFYDKAQVNKWNPVGRYGRIKEGDPNWEVFQFRSIDNPEFNVEALDEERKILAPTTFKIYYEGDIPQVLGSVFPEFSEVKHVASAENRVAGLTEQEWWARINSEAAKFWPRWIGHDVGFGHPAPSTFLNYDPENDKVIVSNEIYLDHDLVDTHLSELARINATYTHKFGRCQYPLDGAEMAGMANELSEVKKYGIYFVRPQDNKEVEKMFRDLEVANEILHGFIAHDRIVFLASRCPRLIGEIPRYHRDRYQGKWGETFKVVREGDDGICATRHALLAMLIEIQIARKKAAKRKPSEKPKYPYAIPSPEPEKKKKRGITVKPIAVKKMIHIGLR